MSIYTKVLPYVYRLDNPITGEFYIGYREANVKLNLPSNIDFPQYKTSAPKVKASFDQFDWYIVAEFFDGIDAYDFEQQLIFENWSNPLLLNQSCFYGNKRFRHPGNGRPSGFEQSEESKIKNRNSHLGKTHSVEAKLKMSKTKSGQNNPRFNAILSDSTINKMRQAKLNLQNLICPYCGKSGDPANFKRWHFDNCKSK